ncbi:MAG: endo-1,4-beta-xylanase [Pseudomonadota bacterium]
MIDMTRRGVLAVGTALAVSGPAPAAQPGLDAIARTKGMRFGSCFSWSPANADRGSFANPAYAALLERDCGVLVPENEFKWQRTRPSAAAFNFAPFDAMIDWSDSKGMKMRGHTLLWHKTERFPRWLNEHDFGANPRKEGERLLTEHIRTLCGRYGKRIYSYDVVNETIDERTGGQRQSSLSKAIGSADAMCDLAYHVAREAAPHAELVYNDYMDWGSDATHRGGVLRLLERFRRDKVPVDTLGIQAHIGPPAGLTIGAAVSQRERGWRDFLDAVVAMGYRLAITEFDVNDRNLPKDHAVRDDAVANFAAGFLEITLSYPQLRDVLVWGMCDKYGWLNGFNPRADGELQRATPYDAGFRAKPLYDAIAGVLRAAPARG